jgi:hypothetical protein
MASESKKRRKRAQKVNPDKRRRKNSNVPPQTKSPFEQDAKRRIGQHAGTGKPPLMKK